MTIQLFSEKLRKSLDERLSGKDPGQDDMLKIGQGLTVIREAIRDLKRFTLTYTFRDRSEEISFFKEAKPYFISLYIYYRKVFAVKLFDSFRDEKSRQQNYEKLLNKMENYAAKNKSLYEYWITGSTDLDHHYFLRNPENNRSVTHDEQFATGYDIKLGKLMAHDLIRTFLFTRSGNSTTTPQSRITWTAAKSSLTELLYALHASGAFDNGSADIKTIAQTFEQAFNISLGNYYRTFQDIRMRKLNPAAFLEDLKKALTRRIAESDD